MKTLIVYASTYGFAQDCVKILSEKINDDVVVYNVADKKDINISNFDNIVIGGSLYAGRVQGKLRKYLANNLDCITNKKVALFLCCADEIKNFDENIKNAYPKLLVENAFAKECFGGEFRFEKMKPFHRFIINLIGNAAKKQNKPEPCIITENILELANAINLAK